MPARDSSGRFVAGVDIKIIDNADSWSRRFRRAFDDVVKSGKRAAKSFQISADLKHAADNVTQFADDMARVVKKPIKTFMDFEAQMSKVRAATFSGDTSAEARQGFEDLSAAARKLGADTQFSGMEAAQGMEILATQGFKTAEQIAAMPGILDIAAASTESIATAADIATASMTQFGLKATDMGRIGDVLIKTSDGSASGLVDIGEALKYVGSNAGAAGISLEKTTAMIGALSNSGVKGSMAGTALRAMLSGFQAPTKQGKSALAFLGINTKDKNGNLRPIEELLAQVDHAMDRKFGAGKGGARRAALFKAIVGEEAASSTGILARAAGSGKLQSLIAANEASSGTAAAKAKDVSNNAAGGAKELDSAFEELQLTIGEVLIPTVVDLLKWTREATIGFTSWAKENPELIKSIGLVAGGLAAIGLTAGPLLKGAAAVNTLISVVRVATAVMMTNPILAIITAIAVAAYLIYDNWEGLSAFFEKHWKAVTAAVGLFMPFMLPIIGAAKTLIENWEPVRDFFINLWNDVTAAFTTAINWIVEKIGWVGEQVEAFSVSVMTPEEAAAYAAQKGAEAEAAAKNSSLFADDLAYDPNVRTSGGPGRWDTPTQITDASASNMEHAINTIASAVGANDNMYGPASPTPEEWQAMQAAAGPALLPTDGSSATSTIFKGDLKITIDSNGAVQKTEMTSSGDPGFETRVNRGGQAA